MDIEKDRHIQGAKIPSDHLLIALTPDGKIVTENKFLTYVRPHNLVRDLSGGRNDSIQINGQLVAIWERTKSKKPPLGY